MAVTELGCRLDEDYPVINWTRHAPMADLWLEIDERYRAGRPIAEQLARVAYRLRLSRRWPRVDCLAMVPGLAVSGRARAAFESLGVPGMRFLGFRINGEPFFLFYTDRRVDCLDRARSEVRFFGPSPAKIKNVNAYAFVEERLLPCDVFTLPELSDGMFFWSQRTLVTDQARAIIDRARLVGLRFENLSPTDAYGEL